ncbi:penicillin acylase family protein [Coralloluteibacterium thermophilus]|uniref:Penicillin acylase family protein n=1 Tax=Coralloluteibacterium thermophilum TaxID=2707049 RepID=A0ABV9NLM9_9GAMM
MRKWLSRLAPIAGLFIVLVLGTGWWALRGSLPVLDGERVLPGLAGPVTVERDALGTVTITAGSEHDALRALGYVHAQERYFEMDLMRRAAAGELAALFGPRALAHDEEVRVHRLRARVREGFDAFAGAQRSQLGAYREGVNAGLADLAARPWPYLLLRRAPSPWLQEDTALVGYAMFFDLQDATNARELALWRLREAVPPALYRLLAPEGSSWDAPLIGEARGDSVLPGPDELDLRSLPHLEAQGAALPAEAPAVGSNNFAVSGALTADGRAIVADDMHLGLRAPNIWFRARLRYPDPRAPGGEVDVGGVTLPGIPGVIVGSNGHVAWGFTNSYGDWADWVLLPEDAEVETVEETIEVAGAEARTLQVEQSAYGPVLERTDDGRRLALHWQAHERGAIRLALLDAARAPDAEALAELAPDMGLPAQNLVAGDSGGRVLWTLAGPRLPRMLAGHPLPRTAPLDPTQPPPAAVLRPAHPVVRDDRIWTANARVVDGELLAVVGDGGYDLGARQRQIHDALLAQERFTEADLLAIQLDDRALFLERWYRLLREVVADAEAPALQRLEAASREWSGRADVEATSYRLARGFRGQVMDRVLEGLLGPARAALGADFRLPRPSQFEATLWPLVSERPAHLLPPGFDSWEALLADAADALATELGQDGGDLAARTWGERNTASICHPLAPALPGPFRDRLCMPREPLPGDAHMPRVQGPAFGASQRMVVAPGHEADGILHMPGGQSGHPLSPFWSAGHADWAAGRPTPFLPGAPEHTLRLAPVARPGAPR